MGQRIYEKPEGTITLELEVKTDYVDHAVHLDLLEDNQPVAKDEEAAEIDFKNLVYLTT